MPRESLAALQTRTRKIITGLRKTYPDAHCELNFSNPLELLIATILSAQCTDKRVNIVTAELFKKYRSAADYASAPLAELEQAVKTTGFFRNKAKNIQGFAREVAERHAGRVPDTMESLLALPGVARKTANVILGVAFGKAEGIVVDTHVRRLALRLGLTREEEPERIEEDLRALLPRKDWIDAGHLLIWHGRRVCDAKKPACHRCVLADRCPSRT